MPSALATSGSMPSALMHFPPEWLMYESAVVLQPLSAANPDATTDIEVERAVFASHRWHTLQTRREQYLSFMESTWGANASNDVLYNLIDAIRRSQSQKTVDTILALPIDLGLPVLDKAGFGVVALECLFTKLRTRKQTAPMLSSSAHNLRLKVTWFDTYLSNAACFSNHNVSEVDWKLYLGFREREEEKREQEEKERERVEKAKLVQDETQKSAQEHMEKRGREARTKSRMSMEERVDENDRPEPENHANTGQMPPPSTDSPAIPFMSITLPRPSPPATARGKKAADEHNQRGKEADILPPEDNDIQHDKPCEKCEAAGLACYGPLNVACRRCKARHITCNYTSESRKKFVAFPRSPILTSSMLRRKRDSKDKTAGSSRRRKRVKVGGNAIHSESAHMDEAGASDSGSEVIEDVRMDSDRNVGHSISVRVGNRMRAKNRVQQLENASGSVADSLANLQQALEAVGGKIGEFSDKVRDLHETMGEFRKACDGVRAARHD